MNVSAPNEPRATSSTSLAPATRVPWSLFPAFATARTSVGSEGGPGTTLDNLFFAYSFTSPSEPTGSLESPSEGSGIAEAFRAWLDLANDQLASNCAWVSEYRAAAPHLVPKLRYLPRDLKCDVWHFEPTVGTATPSLGGDSGRPTATERLRHILDSAVFEVAEPDEETSFEREVAEYVRDYAGAALAAIYRAIFESDRRPDVGAALLEALALLPRRVEQSGRASIFRASLLHAEPEIRFVAARALLRLRGPLTTEALRAAAQRESHPELRRDLTEILRLLDGSGQPAAP